jgi:hypothetical protein
LLEFRIWNCWSWNFYCSKDFPQILILLAWIRIQKLVIPREIPFLRWISCLWAGNFRQNPLPPVDSSFIKWQFLTDSLFVPWSARVGTSRSKHPPDDNHSRILYSHVVRMLVHCFPNVLRMVTIPEVVCTVGLLLNFIKSIPHWQNQCCQIAEIIKQMFLCDISC